MEPGELIADTGLTRALAALLDLSRRARQARSEAELNFLLVNDTLQLASYRQAGLWQADRGLRALSGLVQPEANAPYAQWLKGVAAHLAEAPAAAPALQPVQGASVAPAGLSIAAPTGQPPRPFNARDLPTPLANEWAEWWPAHGLWLPMPEPGPETPAALLLARDEPWSEAEIGLLGEWVGSWWHALLALRRSQKRPWWRPWGRDTAGAISQRRAWWNRPFLIT